MAHNSGSKKSQKDDSDSNSKDEVNDDQAFLIADNARLNDLLYNRDDMLKKPTRRRGSIGLC
jgi:hypothetical protein